MRAPGTGGRERDRSRLVILRWPELHCFLLHETPGHIHFYRAEILQSEH